MLGLVLDVAIVWIVVLLAVLAIAAARIGSPLARILFLDTLAIGLMALLTLVGYARASPHYLDAALALALLGFAGTLAAAKFHADGTLW